MILLNRNEYNWSKHININPVNIKPEKIAIMLIEFNTSWSLNLPFAKKYTDATSTLILPSFGVLYGTEKYGAFNFILRTSYYLRGGFPATSEFENTKFNQGVNELGLLINYRLPVDYYIPWLE